MHLLLQHLFTNAEIYTIALVWIVLPLVGLLGYLRLAPAVRADEDVDGLS